MSIQPGDIVFLRGLAVDATIGFYEWERHVKQTLILDLEIPIDCAKAASTDSVAETINYVAIAERSTAFIQESGFMLVETLAHRLAMALLSEFDIAWVRLSLNKSGAMRGAREVGVTIERHRG